MERGGSKRSSMFCSVCFCGLNSRMFTLSHKKEKSLELNPEEWLKGKPQRTQRLDLSSVEKPNLSWGEMSPFLSSSEFLKSGLEALKQMRHYSGEIITRVVLKLLHSLSRRSPSLQDATEIITILFICAGQLFLSQGLFKQIEPSWVLYRLNGKTVLGGGRGFKKLVFRSPNMRKPITINHGETSSAIKAVGFRKSCFPGVIYSFDVSDKPRQLWLSQVHSDAYRCPEHSKHQSLHLCQNPNYLGDSTMHLCGNQCLKCKIVFIRVKEQSEGGVSCVKEQ